MSEAPPLIGPQPRRTGWIVYSVIVSFFLFLSLLVNLVLLGLLFSGGPSSLSGRRAVYEEQFIDGESDARDKIAVVYLTGVISASKDGYTSEEGMVGDIKDQLHQAVGDNHVKAIIMRINSPGGEVVASDTIYQAVAEVRRSKPIVASIDTVGASGAYYVAVGSDYIIAPDLGITGSVGVILQTFNVRNLMDKIGVEAYTFKSGNLKDILNPTRAPTAEETNLVQNLIMEVYDKFVGIVAKERNKDVNALKNGLADGRILTGSQALEAGFIDDVGYFEDAIDKAKELGNIKKAKVVRYIPPFSLRNVLRIFGRNDQAKIQIQISPQQLQLETGKLYFLPPYMFQ